MSRLLITGSTGNVGQGVLTYLDAVNADYVCGIRMKAGKSLNEMPDQTVCLDFEDAKTFGPALAGIDRVFLVRPPQLTDIKGIFEPFIQQCVASGVKHIVFLSLLGIEKNPLPPHYKIEALIRRSGIAFTFIRPSFFMQNLTTTHLEDIVKRSDLFIPTGNGRISFIDTRDIGEIIGRVLTENGHVNQAYTVTGPVAITCGEVAAAMTSILGREITFSKPSLWTFGREMHGRGIPLAFVSVMAALYLSTQLGMARQVTQTAEALLGRKPRSIETFILDYRDLFST